jgi:hypothetical protein
VGETTDFGYVDRAEKLLRHVLGSGSANYQVLRLETEIRSSVEWCLAQPRLVVLLCEAALHRVAFGRFHIVAFSLGLAVVLIAMGLAVVSAGKLASPLPVDGPSLQR